MVGENILERVVPIVDDVHQQEKDPVRVDTAAEANLTDLKDAIEDAVKHQEEGGIEEMDDIVHHQRSVPVRVDTAAEKTVR
jgi:hypothetical protein